MKYLLILGLLSLTTTLSAQLVGETENGLASYYSNEYQGAETAYGVIYDRNDLVAAHRLYPQNSVVKVRNAENGKTVNVRIIDKGPFIRGRIIELSERAAANIGLLGKETVPVELTLISTPDQAARLAVVEAAPVVVPDVVVAQPQVELATPATTDRPVATPQPAPSTSPAPAAAPPKKPAAAQTSAPAPTVSAAAAQVKATPVSKGTLTRTETFSPGIYKIELLKPPAGDFGVQVGSFIDLDGAMDKVAQLQSKWFDNILIERFGTGPGSIFKVILGPFETQKSAAHYASDLKSRYKINGFTVDISGK